MNIRLITREKKDNYLVIDKYEDKRSPIIQLLTKRNCLLQLHKSYSHIVSEGGFHKEIYKQKKTFQIYCNQLSSPNDNEMMVMMKYQH